MAYAVFGIFLSDKAEQAFGLVPSDEDNKKLQEAMPKLHMVEREKK